MTLADNDWRSITMQFDAMFGDYHTGDRPDGVTGVNFITPELLGYLLIDGESVEVSYGTGIYHEPLFGLTWARQHNGLPDSRDRVCYTLTAVHEALFTDEEDE